MATTAYPTPICLSCAAPSCKDPSSSFLPRSCFKTSKHRPFLIFSIVSVGGSPLSDPAIKPRRKRRHRSSGGGKVFCSISDGPETITACKWNEYVISSDVPVLVEFWASWCGPCAMVRRIMEEISQEYMERMKFYKIDADDYPQIATSYGIDQVPTVLLFKDGNKVESITGTLPKYVYVKAIERNLS
ncbi:thioredoxin M3 [Carex littledalei]|uniref:Thioredoxin M3 n=1 Tax=Carex littledalei TaxID=544730 RepID=A0A833RLC4_9POAL|nr:thioredoxin M3 [Carex littledalei]